MPDYQVKFKARLIPETKPKDWPDTIFNDVLFRADSIPALRDLVDRYLMATHLYGFSVMKKAKKPWQDDLETLDLKILVSPHLLAYVTTKSVRLAKQVPDITDEGEYLQ